MTARQYQAEPVHRLDYVVDGYLVIGERSRRSWLLNPWLHVAAMLALIVVLVVVVVNIGGRFGV